MAGDLKPIDDYSSAVDLKKDKKVCHADFLDFSFFNSIAVLKEEMYCKLGILFRPFYLHLRRNIRAFWSNLSDLQCFSMCMPCGGAFKEH